MIPRSVPASQNKQKVFLIWQFSSATLPVKAATARTRKSGSYLLMLTCCVVTLTRQWFWWLLAAVLVIWWTSESRLALQVQRILETPSLVWKKRKKESLRCPVPVCGRVLWACSRRGLRESGAIERRTRAGMGAPTLCKLHSIHLQQQGWPTWGGHTVFWRLMPPCTSEPLLWLIKQKMIHMQIQRRDLSGEILYINIYNNIYYNIYNILTHQLWGGTNVIMILCLHLKFSQT